MEGFEIEQEIEGLPILKKKSTDQSTSDGLPILKKKESSVSASTASQLPSSGYKSMAEPVMQFGESVSKSIKPSLKEAALKDKKQNESYLAAVYNNVIGSLERLGGGAIRLASKFEGATNPGIQAQKRILEIGGESMGANLIAAKEKEVSDKVKSFIGKARSNASSKEYEKGVISGFDVTDGIGLNDIKALGVILPAMVTDMALAIPTAGTTFAIQGYDDALSTIDEMPEAKNIGEGTRTAFGLGGGIVAGALEKLGLDNILKTPTLKKYVTAKIIKETTEELAKKGVKVTAEQFEDAVTKKATELAEKELIGRTIKQGAKGAIIEGATEVTQEGAMDLLKLAANKLENKEIFDEEEMKDTLASRYLNSAAAGGILGGIGSAAISRFQNVEKVLEQRLKEAKTPNEIQSIVDEINENVKEGNLSEEDANDLQPIIKKYATVLSPEEVTKPEIVQKGNKIEEGTDGKFTASKEGVLITDKLGNPIKFTTREEANEAIKNVPRGTVSGGNIEESVPITTQTSEKQIVETEVPTTVNETGQIESVTEPAILNKFTQGVEMFNEIQNTTGAAKKRTLAENRRIFMEQNPSVKYIDDNIKSIYNQLEKSGKIKKIGDCP